MTRPTQDPLRQDLGQHFSTREIRARKASGEMTVISPEAFRAGPVWARAERRGARVSHES